ncbi:TPA: RNA 2'-phosphotransferase, partial [Bacillus cereus]
KKKHELKENKIRALYGHSIPMKIVKEEGVKFYLGNEKVWLADEIPSEFIAINKN